MRKSHFSVAPKRIAVLGSFPPLRGISGYCLEFALAMSQLVMVKFLSFKKIYPSFLYPGKDLRDDYTFPPKAHAHLKVKRRLTWYNPFTWLLDGVFTHADLLHAQWWSMPLWLVYMVVCGCFKLRGKPLVLTVHNVISHENSYAYTMLSGLLFKLGDHFIVHSAANKEKLVKNYKILPEKITQIPLGPLDFHVPNNFNQKSVHKEIGFDKKERIILLFGAIRLYKGIDTALEAFARVHDEIPESRLLIAGKLWVNWDRYDKLIKRLNIEEYVKKHFGYIPSGDVWRFFAVSDLVILPYHNFDSQSAIGAIALSFHKPMIVTNVGGLPELVEDNRYVAPPKDPQSLAQAIIPCLRNKSRLKSMSENSEKIAAKFAWPIVAEKTWEVYRKVLHISEGSK
jgi:glycosyltransferase involved in cell wall biosynthesis